ncbi:uncharacterized protein CLUP02_10944 [Colletotrichum lupini]|uniref:Uncharacterized protein n=1 Tax=Colletotrichum lupini TaxID=145971 RepID=A0A9Q8WJC7_9PEZI|nr:uncharacterized protein CLUP02_10944 [Colletotrichum lupini]UQC85446.1 hypothetical protein CLUP02_10944 [Colletotrichum lupini]
MAFGSVDHQRYVPLSHNLDLHNVALCFWIFNRLRDGLMRKLWCPPSKESYKILGSNMNIHYAKYKSLLNLPYWSNMSCRSLLESHNARHLSQGLTCREMNGQPVAAEPWILFYDD